MIKRYLLLSFFLCLFLLLSISCKASIVTYYQSCDDVHRINTCIGRQTVILFESPIDFAGLGDVSMFAVDTDDSRYRLIVSPLLFGAQSNLIVMTVDGHSHVFHLAEIGITDYHDLVKILLAPDVDYSCLIDICNKGRLSIDPVLKDVLTVYDVPPNTTYNFQRAGKTMLNILPQRAVLAKHIHKTIFWVRLENPVFGADIGIAISALEFKGRELFAVAADKDILLPGDIVDVYFVLEGCWLDSTNTISVNIDNEKHDFILNDIPLTSKDFTIFEFNGGDTFNITIDNYNNNGGH